MTRANKALVNFAGGEVSPRVTGRTDLPLYSKILERMQNWIAEPQGPARFRSGTIFVRHTRLNHKAVLIPFQFSDIQSYLIEATDLRFRFYKAGGVILETSKAISAIQAAAGLLTGFTITGHGYAVGDELVLQTLTVSGDDISIEDRTMLVDTVPNANTVTATDIFGQPIPIDSVSTAAVGTIARVYEIVTPYAEADLERLKFTQNADTMYLFNRGYAPRKLVRTTETNWSLSTYARTIDPFTGAGEWPAAGKFTDDARLLASGSTNKPETSWFSRSPAASGAVRYDDYTTGTDASHAVIFTLAPVHGKVDSIRWIANTDKFVVLGTFGTVRRVYGATEAEPVTPTAITAKSVNAFGVSYADPVVVGSTLFYIQRGERVLRSIEYDYITDGYASTDKNLVADHLVKSGLKQPLAQIGTPDVIWVVRNDGVLLGMTYQAKENIAGWHRHIIGNGKVKWLGILPRENDPEQLWMIVERTIDGKTVRHVEYISDPPDFPDPVDFFSDMQGDVAKSEDLERFYNAQWEQSKMAVHLDAAATYDGSVYGLAAGASLTPGAGADEQDELGVVFEASAAVFNDTMVGRELWGKYDARGVGGGRAVISSYTDSTHVVCEILSPFPEGASFVAGDWYLTATTVSGLKHLEGQTVSLITDGAVPESEVVTNGSVSIVEPASVIHVGLRYTGIMKTLPLEQGGVTGPAQSKTKIVEKVAIRFINSAGVSYGTSLYKLSTIENRRTSDVTGRPIPLFTGVDDEFYEDEWAENKAVVIVQDQPLPCTIASMDIYTDTSDE